MMLIFLLFQEIVFVRSEPSDSECVDNGGDGLSTCSECNRLNVMTY